MAQEQVEAGGAMSSVVEREQQGTVRPARPTGRIRVVYAALVLAMLLGALDQTIFSTAMPTIVGELHGLEHMAWVTTAYVLAATIGMPVYGKLGDLIGRKPVLVAAIGLFLVGSVVAALADGMSGLIAGRAVQGLGGGGLMITSQAIVADLVPPRQRAKYLAPMGAIFGLSSVAGPLLGGWLTDHYSWRWAFWINVPLGLLAIVVAVVALRLPRPSGRIRLDYCGTALMAVAVTSTVLVGSWGGTEYAWTDPLIVGLAATAVLAWSAFVLVERRAVEPLIPLSLFGNRTFVLATLIGMVGVGVGLFAVVSYMPTYLQMVYGTSATVSGLLLVVMVAGLVVSTTLSGHWLSRTGRYKVFPVVGAGLEVLAAAALSTMSVHTPLWQLCLYLLVMGSGVGLMMQTLVTAVQNAAPARMVGTVTSANNFVREIGATLGTAVVGSVFAGTLSSRLAASLSGDARALVGDTQSLTPELVRSLPDAVRELVVEAYASSLTPIFAGLLPLFGLALVLALFLRDERLSDHRPGDHRPVDERPGTMRESPAATPASAPAVGRRGTDTGADSQAADAPTTAVPHPGSRRSMLEQADDPPCPEYRERSPA